MAFTGNGFGHVVILVWPSHIWEGELAVLALPSPPESRSTSPSAWLVQSLADRFRVPEIRVRRRENRATCQDHKCPDT